MNNESITRSRLESQRSNVLKEFFNSQLPDEIHNFRITSDALPISERDASQFEVAASLMPGFINGMSRIIETSLLDDKLRRSNKLFRNIRSLLNLEGRFTRIMEKDGRDKSLERDLESEQEILGKDFMPLHPFVRLDMIPDLKTGGFRAVEIEVDKLHGFGYTTLLRGMSDSPVGSGLIEQIKQLSSGNTVGMLLSGSERFYEQEATFFQKRARQAGVDLFLITQQQLVLNNEGVMHSSGQELIPMSSILNIPLFAGSRQDREQMFSRIKSLEQQGKVRVISHTEPALTEKGPMALICNAGGDQELELLLRTCFDERSLVGLRSLLPSTFAMQIPGSLSLNDLRAMVLDQSQDFFVKAKDKSGARGVAAPGDINSQAELLRGNLKDVIVQEALQVPFRELPFMDLKTAEIGSDEFSIRFALFTNADRIIDLGLTASPSLIAHGSRNSIQMPNSLKI